MKKMRGKKKKRVQEAKRLRGWERKTTKMMRKRREKKKRKRGSRWQKEETYVELRQNFFYQSFEFITHLSFLPKWKGMVMTHYLGFINYLRNDSVRPIVFTFIPLPLSSNLQTKHVLYFTIISFPTNLPTKRHLSF